MVMVFILQSKQVAGIKYLQKQLEVMTLPFFY